jgi:translation initiation factor IF-3
VRIIGEEGAQIGVLPTPEGIKMAREAGLDLVEVSPNADPPVCKIMDFGKFLYQRSKKDHDSKKKSHKAEVKELRFRPNTDVNDIERKMAKAREFLSAGHRVQFTMLFKGREASHAELGRELLAKLSAQLAEIAKVERNPGAVQARRMSMLLAPREGSGRTYAKAKDAQGDSKADKDNGPREGQAPPGGQEPPAVG